MKVKLDTREKDIEFINYFGEQCSKFGFELEKIKLEVGDIQYGNCLIERKEINDLAMSIASPRMWDQVQKMVLNNEIKSIIIISGRLEDLDYRHKNKIPAIYGGVSKLVNLRIPVLWVDNDRMLSTLALSIFTQTEDIDVPIKHVKKNGVLSTIRSLPGVGAKTGKLLFEQFGCLGNLAGATEEELQNIAGPKTGSKIYKTIWGME